MLQPDAGVSDLSLSLVTLGLKQVANTKKEMKLVFEYRRLRWEPLLLRCRAEDCPRACKSKVAKDWGFVSQKDLFGHLCFYHRSAAQNYDLHSALYSPEATEQLQAMHEGTEELLKQLKEVSLPPRLPGEG